MENNRHNNNNRNRSNGNKGNRNNNNRPVREEKPKRKRRVSVDRDTELVVVNNVPHRFFYENPRLSIVIDLQNMGDEEYLTVGDIRTIMNSSRKIIEGFSLLITDVVDDQYTLEDVLVFLGLDKKYDGYYSLNRKSQGSSIEVSDIKEFLLNSPSHIFEKKMAEIDEKLRARIIEQSIVLFKLKEFGDYNKMRIIEGYVNDELFADAQETEIDNDVYI